MSDLKAERTKKKTVTVKCKIKKTFQFTEKSPLRKRGEEVELSESEYNFALENGCAG